MTATSQIEWTDSTAPVVTGCADISPGCLHCYAKRLAATRLKHQRAYEGLATMREGIPRWTGEFRLHPDRLSEVLSWRKGRRIFWCPTSDLFGAGVPDEFIAACFGVMAATPQHLHIVLTKRAERLPTWFEWVAKREVDGRAMFPDDSPEWRIWQMINVAARRAGIARMLEHHGGPWPLPNVIGMVSVENRKHGLPRIEHLRRAPFALRGLSIEPLLEDLGEVDLNGIDWVIVGGESGHGARPMHPDWVRSIRDQVLRVRASCDTCRGTGHTAPIAGYSLGPACVDCHGRGFHGPALFVKQWGEWALGGLDDARSQVALLHDGTSIPWPFDPAKIPAEIANRWHGATLMSRVGKTRAGCELDGRTWAEMPRRSA
jgi:protein gp37